MTRSSLPKNNTKAYNLLIESSNSADEFALSSGLEEGFIHLIKLRISQINGCAFCIRLHTRDAEKCDVSSDKIALVAAWNENDYFTDKEKSALALAESVNFIHKGHIPNDVYNNAAEHWNDAQIAAIEWLSAIMGTFNRIAIASRYTVKP